MTFTQLEPVVLTHDVPQHGLKAGDLGAIVEVYGADGLEVEFVRASGETKALLTLRPADVRSLAGNDILAVRAS
jgi:hypothetical protein